MRLIGTAAVAALIFVLAGCSKLEPTSPPIETIEPNATSQAVDAGSENQAEPSGTPTENQDPNAADKNGSEPTSLDSTEKDTSNEKAPVARAPKRNGEAEHITFDDLICGMQADIQFRPWMLTDRVKELDGQRVRVAGYMHPDAKQKGITEFVLLRNTECKFGPSGQADHLIRVKLKNGVTTSFSISPIEVTGTLTVNPFTGPDGNTWSIYDMEGEAVGTPRR